MRILISGASGLIGRAVSVAMVNEGHQVSRLVRSGKQLVAGDIAWTPGVELAPDVLRDVDAVVNLAGRTVAGRWTDRVKAEIRDSRVPSTAALARSIAASYKQFGKPSVLVSASAIGYYGSRGDEVLAEASSPGHGFLAEVCRQWEAATAAASDAGVRVVTPRIGLVLSADGGALAKLLPLFRLGLGGRIANGRQWWSWISLEDLVAILIFAITNVSVRGPLNASAPSALTNADFTRALAEVVHRPAIFPLPATIARMLFTGGAADEMLLASQRVAPAKLEQLGFEFHDRDLKATLRRIAQR
jgi:uncharacterized protein